MIADFGGCGCCGCVDLGGPAGAKPGETFISRVQLTSAVGPAHPTGGMNEKFPAPGGGFDHPAGTYRVLYACGAFVFTTGGNRWAAAMQNNRINYTGGSVEIPLTAGALDQKTAEKWLHLYAGPVWDTGYFNHGGGEIIYHFEDESGPPYYADNMEGHDPLAPDRNGSQRNPAFALFRLAT